MTGTYTVVVDPRDQQTGTLTFLLSPVADNTGTTAIGTPTTVTTTTIGENAERTFTGTAGQKLTLQVSGNTSPTASTSPSAHPTAPSSPLCSCRDPTGFRDVFTLPATGDLHRHVDPRGQQTGTLTFLLGAGGRQHRHHRHRHADHRDHDDHRRERRAHLHRHRRPAAHLAVSGNTFTDGVDLTVRAPGDTFVAALFVSDPTGFRDMFTLPDTGTYTVVVDPRDQQTGSLTFLLGRPQALALVAAAAPGARPRSPSTFTRRAVTAQAVVDDQRRGVRVRSRGGRRRRRSRSPSPSCWPTTGRGPPTSRHRRSPSPR